MYLSDFSKKIIIGTSCLLTGIGGGFAIGQIVTKKIIDNRMSENLGIALYDVKQITGTGLFISREGINFMSESEELEEYEQLDDVLKINDYISDVNDVESDDNDDVEDAADSLTARLNRMKDEIDEMKVMTESPSEEDKPVEPYIITPEEFSDENLNYYKESVTYLVEDGVVLDENDNVIDDVDRYLGLANLDVLKKHEDLAMLYIRNENTYTDYEVEKVYSNYLTYTGAETMDTASDEVE